MEQKDLLLAHMDDLADKAVKTGCAASRFLTPAEQRDAASHVARSRKTMDVNLTFDGGYEDAERTRAVFTNAEWGAYERNELFTALKIEWRSQDTLGHRDILGALMALGIERDTVGDIVGKDNTATLVCLPEMIKFIAENLSIAGRVGVKITEISLGYTTLDLSVNNL